MNVGQEKPGSDERPRQQGRRRFSERLKHWWRDSWIADKWWRLGDRLFDWWHPPPDNAYPGSGYYGGYRSNRLSQAWWQLLDRIRNSGPVNLVSALLWRLHDWWYPPSKNPYPNYGGYASVQRSRFARARRNLRRRIAHSAFGRWCVALYDRFYEWWYPILDDGYPYSGYYGRRRVSRPVMLWRKLMRRVHNSWLGKRYREWSDRFQEWWYPPSQASQSHYPHYHNRPVSRPVLAFRRWHRRFRKTWVGRELGWILDEVLVLIDFLQAEVEQAFSWRRIKQFLSKKQTIAALVVFVLAAGAGFKYGRPHYRRYVEQQYARQAEQFMLKGDFARAYLRTRQVTEINPNNVVACRVNAELADWANSPFALYWRQRTVQLAPTVTNRLAP